MLTRRLYIKDSPELWNLKGHQLLNKVIKTSKLAKKCRTGFIPVKYICIVSDGQDIVSFKHENGERSLYFTVHPKAKTLLKPSLKRIFSKTSQDLFDIKNYFNIEISDGLEFSDVVQVIDNNFALKVSDCILLPKVIFIESESPVNMTPKRDKEIDEINIFSAMQNIDSTEEEYNLDELSKYILFQLSVGKIFIPSSDSEVF